MSLDVLDAPLRPRGQPGINRRAEFEDFLDTAMPSDFRLEGDEIPAFLNTAAIQRVILERPPFFFVEKAILVTSASKKTAVVWGKAPMTAERSDGHFNGRPIVPLIDLCKAMAQTGIILTAFQGDLSQAPIAIAAGKSKARAKELIDAPVTVLTRVELTRARLRVFVVDGMTYVDGKAIGSLEEILYTLVDRNELLRK